METFFNSTLTETKWRREFMRDYLRDTRFKVLMGSGSNNVIITMSELQSQAGRTIIVPFVGELTGSGVSGSQMLRGNEEALESGSMPITIDWRRNAVTMPKSERSKSGIDLLSAARPALRRWLMVQTRNEIIRELGAITVNDASQTSVPYASATEVQKDAWVANNSDRILFGANVSNNSSNDHSASLANIDTTNDRFSVALATKAKRIATEANLTPFQSDQTKGEEWYIMLMGSRGFRDAENDATILQADRDARMRGVTDNPIFNGGDLTYRGIIFRHEPEIDVIAGVGAASSDVEPAYLVGAQAVAVAYGQEAQPTSQLDDYGFRSGVGIEELQGTKKIAKDGVQRGIVTVYLSAPADS